MQRENRKKQLTAALCLLAPLLALALAVIVATRFFVPGWLG